MMCSINVSDQRFWLGNELNLTGLRTAVELSQLSVTNSAYPSSENFDVSLFFFPLFNQDSLPGCINVATSLYSVRCHQQGARRDTAAGERSDGSRVKPKGRCHWTGVTGVTRQSPSKAIALHLTNGRGSIWSGPCPGWLGRSGRCWWPQSQILSLDERQKKLKNMINEY